MNLTLHAPAKINLSLRILGRREDGFHELETLMVPVPNLYDTLAFTRTNDEAAFSCSRTDLSGSDNLVVRAIRLLEDATGKPLPLRIHLDKQIPSGAGLGGGSSDAAATLQAVNQLYDLNLPDKTLHTVASELGSDVPFFLQTGACWCRGRGEQLKPIDFPHELNILLLRHAIDIPTPWAYQQWADSRERPEFPYAPQPMPWGEIVNDLERPTFQKVLILGHTKRWLLEQPEVEAAAMTGSGSALFALLKESNTEARQQLTHRARTHYGESLWVC